MEGVGRGGTEGEEEKVKYKRLLVKRVPYILSFSN